MCWKQDSEVCTTHEGTAAVFSSLWTFVTLTLCLSVSHTHSSLFSHCSAPLLCSITKLHSFSSIQTHHFVYFLFICLQTYTRETTPKGPESKDGQQDVCQFIPSASSAVNAIRIQEGLHPTSRTSIRCSRGTDPGILIRICKEHCLPGSPHGV